MATYDNLPVYKESYDLLVKLFTFTKDFSREYKYTIGQSIKNEVLELIRCIYRANSGYAKRREYIQSARENIETVRVYLRLLYDLKQINIKKFTEINSSIESVSKQLVSWQQSLKS